MKKIIISIFAMVLLASAVNAYPIIGSSGSNYWNISGTSLTYSGNIGIGTDSPTEKLTVVGNVSATGDLSLGSRMIFSLGEMIDNLVDGFLRVTGNLIVQGNINVTGNATFDEGVTLGKYSTKPTCNSAVSGMMVYDTVIGKPYVCDGSDWNPLDSDGDEDGFLRGSGTITTGNFSGYTYDCNDSNSSISYSSDGTCDGDSDNYIDVLAGGNDCNDSNSDAYPNSLCGYDGSCILLTDDSNCGTIDCDELNSYFDNGTDSATGTNYCVLTDYEDITTNRCEGINDCKDANSEDCTSAVNSTVATCGTCEYCDGSACANYAEGTDSGSCRECDGAGGEHMPTDDSDCGTIDCSGYYVQTGTEGATSTETCYNKIDITTSRCEALGDCKDANTADCSTQSNDASQYTCGTCKYISGSSCTGTTLGSCSNYGTSTSCDSFTAEGMTCDGSGSCDYDSYTVLMLSFDGTDDSTNNVDFVDSSSSAHTVTQEGNAKLENTQKKFGVTSLQPSTSSDYVQTPDSNDWSFGSGDFTIDFWVYPSSVSGYRGVAGHGSSFGGGAETGWWILMYDNTIRFQIMSSGSNQVSIISTGVMQANTWQHVAVVRSGTSFKIYVGGSEVASATSSYTIPDYTLPLKVGAISNMGFLGYIDEVRISKGIARWTSGFTPPSGPYSP